VKTGFLLEWRGMGVLTESSVVLAFFSSGGWLILLLRLEPCMLLLQPPAAHNTPTWCLASLAMLMRTAKNALFRRRSAIAVWWQ
jgi:hypothetical protein